MILIITKLKAWLFALSNTIKALAGLYIASDIKHA